MICGISNQNLIDQTCTHTASLLGLSKTMCVSVCVFTCLFTHVSKQAFETQKINEINEAIYTQSAYKLLQSWLM